MTFDHNKNDECVIQYKQTADLDSGSAHNEGPPKIQKPTQSIKLPENPLLRVLYKLYNIIYTHHKYNHHIFTRKFQVGTV